MPRTETEREPEIYFSTKASRSPITDALDAIKKCRKSDLKDFLLQKISEYDLNEKKYLSVEYDSVVRRIGDVILRQMQDRTQLTQILKAGIQLLISLSMAQRRGVIENVGMYLGLILSDLKEKKATDFEWLYDTLTQYLTQSQLEKLTKAYMPDGIEPRSVTGKNANLLGRMRSALVADTVPADFSQKRESEFEMASKLIKLYTSLTYKSIVKGSSAGFLGLDRSGKEAISWKELEMSRSKNKDLAKLAGAVAWKTWLFKRPLLKKYCADNNIVYADLPFSQRAELTKKALETYREEEVSKILDDAVEAELERRKKVFKPETREKFKGKRMSLGAELEINIPPIDLGVLYGWFENIDRERVNDNIAYKKEVEEQFAKLAVWRDLEEEYVKIWRIAQKAKDLLLAATSDEPIQTESTVFNEKVKELVEQITKPDLKDLLSQVVSDPANNLADPELLQVISDHWQGVLSRIEPKREAAKKNFFAFVTPKSDDRGYARKGIQAMDHQKPASRDAKIMFDIFQHRMGQAQALGHPYKGDSFGEYAFDYISGDFHDPYGLFSREIWELAHASFHDLEVTERPLHMTLGWREYYNRGLVLTESEAKREASLIHFALSFSGVGYRKAITDFHAQNLEAKAQGKEGATLTEYGDTGRETIIRIRESGYFSTMEFRGFAPSKKDFPKLSRQLGNLGTAMIAWFAVNKLDNFDAIDVKLAKIYIEFRQKMVELHAQYDNLPSLFNANRTTRSHNASVEQIYREISNTFEDEDGLMNRIAKLVSDTERQVEAVFKEEDVPPPGIEPGAAA